MTRHQRRKAAKARALAVSRAEIVRRNLSTPRVLSRSDGLVSHIYGGAALDRARGFGTVPMTRPASGYRVVGRKPGGRVASGLKDPLQYYHQRDVLPRIEHD
jgi:hypothetical protein